MLPGLNHVYSGILAELSFALACEVSDHVEYAPLSQFDTADRLFQ